MQIACAIPTRLLVGALSVRQISSTLKQLEKKMRRLLLASLGIAASFVVFDTALAVPSLASNDTAAITTEQRTRLSLRLRLIDQIVRAVDADLRKGENASVRRQWMMESLYSMPLEKLQALGAPANFRALSDAIARAAGVRAAQKALGSTTDDLVYKPVAPCRFVDTRIVGGKISGSRSFDISQNGNTYGGDVNCNITTL